MNEKNVTRVPIKGIYYSYEHLPPSVSQIKLQQMPVFIETHIPSWRVRGDFEFQVPLY